MNKRDILTFVAVMFAVWVGLTAVSYIVTKSIVDPNDSRRFVDRGERVWATVLSKNVDVVDAFGIPKPNSITYNYEVGGILHTGIGYAGEGTPKFDQISVGDKITAYYDSQRPEDSTLGNPQNELQPTEQLVHVITATTPIFPMITVGAILFVIMGRRKKNSGEGFRERS